MIGEILEHWYAGRPLRVIVRSLVAVDGFVLNDDEAEGVGRMAEHLVELWPQPRYRERVGAHVILGLRPAVEGRGIGPLTRAGIPGSSRLRSAQGSAG